MSLKQAPLTTALLVAALVLAACGGAPAGQQQASPAAEPSPAAAASPAAGAIGQVGASPASAGGQVGASPAAAGGTSAQASPGAVSVAPGQMLQKVRSRGQLICGVHGTLPGFGNVDAQGNFVGFDVDFCKAVAAAIFGDASKVQYRPLSAQERFTAVQSGEVDLLSRNTTWTISRDTSVGMDFAPVTFYDGQGIMVRKSENITSLEQLDGASICVQSGTTTELNLADAFRARGLNYTPVVFADADPTAAAYDEGRCDAFTTDKSGLAATRLKFQNPDDHVILDVTLSKEPLAPAVLQGDPQWRDIVSWVIFGVISAEEYGITQQNVDTFLNSDDPNIRRMLGVEGELGQGLGLENNFMVNVIKAVGNYGEIYNRHLGPDTPINIPRGLNQLYTNGGLMYAPPFR
ncbi:amino acid ABC transporter substrate-binding protein [Kallotenue papyrolyticum]|uniref:amino acid ABC transporter substrate-binding protein n=1 Tax=Kallotenue papyrolyticum TaxID=1325125 RepID=UPI0004785CB7|nr:amino acid ABC transporter substrate-binding protein [Kallotenue papyrolyticum]